MFRNIFEVPKKHKTLILFSLALMFWMLIAVWQLGGMSLYAFILTLLITLLMYFMIGCLYLKPKVDKRKVLVGVLGINLIIMLSGMILSAMLKKDMFAGYLQLKESQCITQEAMLDPKNADVAEMIPSVTLTNIADGVNLNWNVVTDVDGYAIFKKTQNETEYNFVAMVLNPNVVNYLDYGSEPNTTYIYAVCALKDGKTGKCIPQEFVTGIWRPQVSITQIGTDVLIEWTKISGVSDYRIYRRETNGGTYVELAMLSGEDTLSYVDTSSAFGVKYTYAVRGCVGELLGFSRTKDVMLTMENTVVQASSTEEGVKVTWQPTEFAESYNVYHKKGDEKFEKIANVPADTMEYLDKDVVGNSEYSYAVRAVRGSYLNKYDAVTITTGDFSERDKQIVEALGRVTIELSKAGSSDKPAVKLVWSKVSGAEGYHIYRKPDGEGDYTLINTIADAETDTFIDENVEKGKSYLYYVCAYIGTHDGSYTGSKIDLK